MPWRTPIPTTPARGRGLASPSGGGVCGVLILEHFDTSADWDVATRRRVELAAPQAAAALAHALQFRDLPLSWLGRGLQRLGWRGTRTLPRLGMALALHVGEVNYGNIGVPGRLDFTVTGSVVNQVARIEELCKRLDKPVLATAPVAALVGSELVPLGSHPLRGVGTPLEVFTLPELA